MLVSFEWPADFDSPQTAMPPGEGADIMETKMEEEGTAELNKKEIMEHKTQKAETRTETQPTKRHNGIGAQGDLMNLRWV